MGQSQVASGKAGGAFNVIDTHNTILESLRSHGEKVLLCSKEYRRQGIRSRPWWRVDFAHVAIGNREWFATREDNRAILRVLGFSRLADRVATSPNPAYDSVAGQKALEQHDCPEGADGE